jgi:hypothetical protein
MREKDQRVIDAEFRVVGEGRWEPFKRWVYSHKPEHGWAWRGLEKLLSLAGLLAFVVVIRLLGSVVSRAVFGS